MNAEMQIPRKAEEVKSFGLRNAYQVNPEMEYNLGKSAHHVRNNVKMYAELTGKTTVRSRGNKLCDNKMRWMGVRWMRSNHIPTLTGAAAVTAASATGGSLASGTYYTAVEYIDANTGFPVQVSQAASLSVGSTGKITLTTPTATAYVYNVYIGSSATALYKSLSLQAAASAVSMSATSSSGLLGGIPASGKVVHFSWVFGKEAFTVVDLQKLQTFLTPNQASDSDPLAQRRKAGWKLMFKAVINNEDFLERMESLSAYD